MPATKDAVTGDPLVTFHFALELQGAVTGYFTECGGLGSETEVTEAKITAKDGKTPIVRKVPGRLKWGDISLKRGITANLDMWDWRKMVEDGNVSTARKDGSIMMYSQEGAEIARWNFVAGWPSKVSGPQLNTEQSGIGIEEMTIVHEGITRAT